MDGPPSQSEWDEMQREVRNVRSLLGVGDGESLVGSDAHARLKAELEEARELNQFNFNRLFRQS